VAQDAKVGNAARPVAALRHDDRLHTDQEGVLMSAHNFRITLEYTGGKKEADPPAPLSFEVGNHDDIFEIIARVRGAGRFEHDEAAALALGMKLFSEVMLAHRDDPLFAPIAAAYREYIMAFKAQMRAANEAGNTGQPG
jgi:hypothetical protein